MAIAVPTCLCVVIIFIITPAMVYWCRKHFACECAYQRRTKEREVPVMQNVVEMKTCSNELWDSGIVAEIGGLGVCPTRLTIEKDIGEGPFNCLNNPFEKCSIICL